jgi:hypothetical protein
MKIKKVSVFIMTKQITPNSSKLHHYLNTGWFKCKSPSVSEKFTGVLIKKLYKKVKKNA